MFVFFSSVEMPPFKQQSFSGYLTVNKEYNSNMFFWFFPAQNGNKPDTPVMLWLQGGPGASSLFALFTEIGPIYIDGNQNIQPRAVTWNKNYHLLFVDNPVGTGYSFTSSDQGYARSQDDVARDLYSALTQFFQIYTDYASNPFIVTGESYAGKYVPSITYKIHVENQNPQVKVKINLKGMTIGDGLTDPVNQYMYGDFLYQVSNKEPPAPVLFVSLLRSVWLIWHKRPTSICKQLWCVMPLSKDATSMRFIRLMLFSTVISSIRPPTSTTSLVSKTTSTIY